MLIDSHAHLNFAELLSDIDGVLERARLAGVEKIICVGTNLEDSRIAIELARKYENVFATVGIHPDSPSPSASDWSKFEKMALQPKVVAIGECGLDYSRIKNYELSIMVAEKERQKTLFEKQIEIAGKLNLPLVIHCREAQEELKKILAKGGMTHGGVLHCFAGGMEIPENFYISFAGNVTFKNAKNLQELARLIPLEKLLVETDCPFLAPEPFRGSQNEPANVKITATVLAELHQITLEKLSEITTANAIKLFDF
ncbi:TatD family hydrolase [Candidatus Gottesmanbacteria bacterium]|nr:TatD family hydrolase [Candidatus Gottesmanbacteria bacterium]